MIHNISTIQFVMNHFFISVPGENYRVAWDEMMLKKDIPTDCVLRDLYAGTWGSVLAVEAEKMAEQLHEFAYMQAVDHDSFMRFFRSNSFRQAITDADALDILLGILPNSNDAMIDVLNRMLSQSGDIHVVRKPAHEAVIRPAFSVHYAEIRGMYFPYRCLTDETGKNILVTAKYRHRNLSIFLKDFLERHFQQCVSENLLYEPDDVLLLSLAIEGVKEQA